MSDFIRWRRATLCNGNSACAEVAWVAAGSHNGNCLLAGTVGGEVWLRDSKLGDDSPILRFTAAEWEAFTVGVLAGEFDAEVLAVPGERPGGDGSGGPLAEPLNVS
ncbi:DUF397 domain-containing protein [Nonomuraea sp. NPDC050790]|uniref:DUF397 domain-containing protein n=1 Tax=Nonomuraea sp. NPDC050790 TaxID=3364371 RepID=UPI0037BC899D